MVAIDSVHRLGYVHICISVTNTDQFNSIQFNFISRLKVH